MSQSSPGRSLWIGLIIIAVGALFLLDNLDFYHFHLPYWVFSWKTILIIIGAALLGSGKRGGLVLIIVGGLFLLPDIFNIPRFYLRTWWPVILIAVGFLIILRRGGPGRSVDSRTIKSSSTSGTSEEQSTESTDSTLDYIDDVSILGGSNRKIKSQSFRGGKITAILGGCELDFRGSSLAPGMHVLDLVTVFGGATIIVPEDWHIKIEVTNILGGFGDKRTSVPTEDTSKILVIKGIALFGGGEIKNA